MNRDDPVIALALRALETHGPALSFEIMRTAAATVQDILYLAHLAGPEDARTVVIYALDRAASNAPQRPSKPGSNGG